MQDQRKENYFPAGVAPKILTIGAIESMLRIGPMLSTEYTDTWLLWLAALCILSASTLLHAEQPQARVWVFGVGLMLATLGGVYLFDNRVAGILGELIGYTVGSIFLFTSHVLANKDLDSFGDSPHSLFGSAGGIIMVLISMLAFICTAMRFSAVSA
jgi:hypothetical protein